MHRNGGERLNHFLRTAFLTGFFLLLLLGIVSREVRAQSMQNMIEQLGIKEFARDYLAPGAEVLGTTLNSGMFQTAKIRKASMSESV